MFTNIINKEIAKEIEYKKPKSLEDAFHIAMKYEQTFGRKTKEIALNYSRSSYCNRYGRNNHSTSQCFANLNKLNKFS